MSESDELAELVSWSAGRSVSVSSSTFEWSSTGGIGLQGCVRKVLGGARLRLVAVLVLTPRLVLHSLSLLLRLEQSELSDACEGGGPGSRSD